MNQSLYNSFKEIVYKITKGDDKMEDLFHDTIIQLYNNKKFLSLSENERKYFFVKSIMNQYFSNTSYFHRTYKKHTFTEFDYNKEIIDEKYQERPTLDWIHETLDKELRDNPKEWYNIGLFKLYLELKKIHQVHLRTKIPKYSIRITIKEMKQFLINKWKDYNNGTD